jgi:hypothetical protein
MQNKKRETEDIFRLRQQQKKPKNWGSAFSWHEF